MGEKLDRIYFDLGAQAMQSRIVAWLMMKGHLNIAPEILALSLPKFQVPEQVTIGKQE